jgi:PAS domain-containing protein
LNPIEPRPLHRGWPLYEPPRHFELGYVLNNPVADLADFAVRQALGHNQAGWWECDLTNERITWTAGIYEIFGLPQGAAVTRAEAVSLYSEDSHALMEKLRSYSIAQRQGFVADARIRPASGEPERWMRLIGAPVSEGGRTVRLHGIKLWL